MDDAGVNPWIETGKRGTVPYGGGTDAITEIAGIFAGVQVGGGIARGGRELPPIFQGPQGYVSPSWYPSKALTGKVATMGQYQRRLVSEPYCLIINSFLEYIDTRVDDPFREQRGLAIRPPMTTSGKEGDLSRRSY
jgi:hypothetical protein